VKNGPLPLSINIDLLFTSPPASGKAIRIATSLMLNLSLAPSNYDFFFFFKIFFVSFKGFFSVYEMDASSLRELKQRLEDDLSYVEQEHWSLFDEILHLLDSDDEEIQRLGKSSAPVFEMTKCLKAGPIRRGDYDRPAVEKRVFRERSLSQVL
jgi:hypothetical protein